MGNPVYWSTPRAMALSLIWKPCCEVLETDVVEVVDEVLGVEDVVREVEEVLVDWVVEGVV